MRPNVPFHRASVDLNIMAPNPLPGMLKNKNDGLLQKSECAHRELLKTCDYQILALNCDIGMSLPGCIVGSGAKSHDSREAYRIIVEDTLKTGYKRKCSRGIMQ